MRRDDRAAASRLEGIMAEHAAREQRTLSDLRRAGFDFETITAAKRRLTLQRRMPGFTQTQIDIAIRVAEQKRRNA